MIIDNEVLFLEKTLELKNDFSIKNSKFYFLNNVDPVFRILNCGPSVNGVIEGCYIRNISDNITPQDIVADPIFLNDLANSEYEYDVFSRDRKIKHKKVY